MYQHPACVSRMDGDWGQTDFFTFAAAGLRDGRTGLF